MSVVNLDLCWGGGGAPGALIVQEKKWAGHRPLPMERGSLTAAGPHWSSRGSTAAGSASAASLSRPFL